VQEGAGCRHCDATKITHAYSVSTGQVKCEDECEYRASKMRGCLIKKDRGSANWKVLTSCTGASYLAQEKGSRGLDRL